MIVAMLGVYLCKAFGLTGPAILIGAVAGVVCALVFSALVSRKKGGSGSASTEACIPVGGDLGRPSPSEFASHDSTPVGGDLGRPSTSEDASPHEDGERR